VVNFREPLARAQHLVEAILQEKQRHSGAGWFQFDSTYSISVHMLGIPYLKKGGISMYNFAWGHKRLRY